MSNSWRRYSFSILLLVFSFFLDFSNDGTMKRYLEYRPPYVLRGVEEGSMRIGVPPPPSSVFSLLYETRKLVKRVIMLNGRAAGSREYPFSLPSPRSRVPFSSLSLSLLLRHRLILPASLLASRRQPRAGDHTRRIALSLSRFDNTLTRESFRRVIEDR